MRKQSSNFDRSHVLLSEIETLESRRLLSAGDVDLSFGTSGQIVGKATAAANNLNWPMLSAIVQQSDGKLIAAGTAYTWPMGRIIISRLSAKGDLDSTFANMGVAGITVDAPFVTVCGVAIDSSKRIIVAATLTDKAGHSFAAVARFLSDGRPDTSFSGDGVATTHFGRVNGYANGVAVMSDGRIVVAGSADDGDPGTSGRMAVARFTTSGKLDTSFSADGLQTIDCNPGADSAAAVAVLSNGSVILGGYTSLGPYLPGDFAVVKLTSSGQLDKSFDGNGIAAANFGYSGGADAMLVQSDGKIVLAGAGTASMYGYPFVALARFTSTGALDPNFSGDGKVGKGESTEPNSYGADPEHFTLLRTADGTYRVFDAAQDYDSSSTIETRFDANGVMQSNQASFPSAFQNVIQLKDGTFAGVSNVFDGYMRYYTPTVTFFDLNDKDLGSNGIQFDTGFAPGVIDSSGKLVLSSITQTGQYLLYRFSTNGKLDASFAQGGRTVFNDNPDYILDVPTIWPLGDGRLVLAGGGHDNQEGFYLGMGMQVSRLNIDGSRDQTYKSGPEYPAYAGARALLPHGNVSVGYVPWSEWDDQTIGIGVLVRSDGTSASVSTEPDSDSDNYTEVDRVLPVRGSNALIVLLKYNFLTLLDPNDPNSWGYTASYSVARENGDGQFDPTFGNNGSLGGYYDLLDTTGDAKILYVMPNGGGVKRLNVDGSPDATFGTGGVAGAGYTHFTVDELDRIIAWETTGTNSADVKIARYTPDGYLDNTFGGGDGITIVHRPVLGDANVIITPSNGMVVTSLKQTGDVYNWFATRLQGDSGAGMDGSTLRVAGSTNGDKISLVKSGTSIKVTINGAVKSFAISSVKSIQINGNAGDDSISLGNGLIGARIDGGDGNDLLMGGSGNDTLIGGGGADILSGGSGIDTADYSAATGNLVVNVDNVPNDGVAGENDNVRDDVENVTGGSGNDKITGSSANNILRGGKGNDSLYGGGGADALFGDDGNDLLDGGTGDDYLQGGIGNDASFGRDGNDKLDAGDGNDYLEGNAGNDSMLGGAGNDSLNGGSGHDKFYGEAGNDALFAKDGTTDTLDGGNGYDKAQRDNSSTIKDQVLNIEAFI